MTFPWRKAKGKRFSQIVTKHKNGSSLMIKTGFPASLADLFLKHRKRLTNSNTNTHNSNCNNKNNNSSSSSSNSSGNVFKRKKKKTSPVISPVSIPESVPSQVSSNFPSPLRLSPVSQISVPSPCREMVVFGEGDDVIVKREVLDGKRVFMAVMMFFVVILGLGMKGFALGIALSAFLLLSMEYVGRRMGGLLGTFSSSLRGFLSRHKKVLMMIGGCFSRGVEEPIGEGKSDSSDGSLSYTSDCEMNIDLMSEIHAVQTCNDMEKLVLEDMCGKGEEEVLGEKKQEMVIYSSELQLSDGDTRRATRKSTLGSKIKKIASKLKKQKKAKELNSESSGSGIAQIKNQGDNWREFEVESDGESTSTQFSVIRRNLDVDRVKIRDSMCSEDSTNRNLVVDKGRYRNLSSGGCLVILVIVLAGLLGGRVLAIVLTVSWFWILKFRRGA